MTYLFLGTHSESLESGRPLFFGDTVDSSELTEADARLEAQGLLVPQDALAPAPTPAPAPAPTPAPEPAPTPAPTEAPSPSTTED